MHAMSIFARMSVRLLGEITQRFLLKIPEIDGKTKERTE